VLELVSKFRYLGTMVDDKGDHSLEVRCRIEQARNAFSRLKEFSVTDT
ncbi:jg3640, partial [Pararge aegeria aegeria]